MDRYAQLLATPAENWSYLDTEYMRVEIGDFKNYMGEVVHTGLEKQGEDLMHTYVDGAIDMYNDEREREEEGASELPDPDFDNVFERIRERGASMVGGTTRSVFGGQGKQQVRRH